MFKKLRALFLRRSSGSTGDSASRKSKKVTIAPGFHQDYYIDFTIGDDGVAQLIDSEGGTRSIPASAMVDGGQPWVWGSLVTLRGHGRPSEMIVIRKTLDEIRDKFAEKNLVSQF